MRIALLSRSHPAIGGVQTWLADLAAGLQARGHECTVGLAGGLRFHDPARFAGAHPGLAWREVRCETGSPAGRRMAVAAFLRDARADVVIPVMLHDALAVACATGARLGHRVIYPVHEIAPGPAADLRRFAPAISVAVSVDAGSDALIARSAPALDRRRIPCGVPLPPAPAAARAGGVIVVGYCGRLESAHKRVMDLVPLLRELNEGDARAELALAGEGSERDALLAAFAREGLARSVRDLGGNTRERLYRGFYPELDVLVITSEWETGPLVAFEAMAHGVPVVCADFAGRADTAALRDGENCLVFPVGDTAAAAAAIRRLAGDPALRDRLAAAGRDLVQHERGLPVMLDRWQRLVEEDLPAPGTPAPPAIGAVRRLEEYARRVLRRRFVHASAGEEWPAYGA